MGRNIGTLLFSGSIAMSALRHYNAEENEKAIKIMKKKYRPTVESVMYMGYGDMV